MGEKWERNVSFGTFCTWPMSLLVSVLEFHRGIPYYIGGLSSKEFQDRQGKK